MGDAGVRPNWRQIPVVELTDAEVAQMTQAELRWASHLLDERANGVREVEQAKEAEPAAVIVIDAGGIAVMGSGARIQIIPGEGANDETFAGELLNSTEHEMRGQAHISCLWDRSKVVRVDPDPSRTLHGER